MQRGGAQLWRVATSMLMPPANLSAVGLVSWDERFFRTSVLSGLWQPGTWLVLDTRTSQVLAAAPDDARLAWDDLLADPYPEFGK